MATRPRVHGADSLKSPWSPGSAAPRILMRGGMGTRPGAWWRFERPIEVLEAATPTAVCGVLARVDEASRAGLWAAGFVSYEAATAFDPALRTRSAPPEVPLAWFGLFRGPDAMSGAACSPRLDDLPPVRNLRATISDAAYLRAVAAVREQIARGETYQANLTYRLRGVLEPVSDSDGADPGVASLRLFRHLVAGQGDAYAAYLELEHATVCSASPELFFHRSGRSMVCRPMKGTAARGRTEMEDRWAAASLRGSAKERAENLMIVDMIRNDLGRIARPGSVEVRELFRIERYPTLFQMISEVSAESDARLPDLFGALFPCASITGAPKVRTMEILAGLESTPRGLYTGAIGFVAPGGDARFSVAIRTAWLGEGERERPAGGATRCGGGLAVEYGTGSGVVWDSEARRELEETRTKALILAPQGRGTATEPGRPRKGAGITARAVGAAPVERDIAHRGREKGDEIQMLETLLWRARPEVAGRSDRESRSGAVAGGALPGDAGFVLLERHLERLLRSAGALGFSIEHAAVRTHLDEVSRSLAADDRPSDHRVRLLVSRHGQVATEVSSCTPIGRTWSLALASEPIDDRDPLLGHKTTRRTVYDRALTRARERSPAVDDVLLWNRGGELTESTVGNLVVEIAGELLTPPLACGLLPGTFRAELLERRVLREARLRCEDLERASRIALINSVRGWIDARVEPAPGIGRLQRPRRSGHSGYTPVETTS